ncbi:hypothetical protein EMCRGX_G033643 [Ephydatia muelleri]
MMAELVQKQLLELSSSSTMHKADEKTAPASAAATSGTEPTYRSGIAARRCHNHGSSGYEASDGSASGRTTANTSFTGLLSSLPSARARARSRAAASESGCELELENNVKATENNQSHISPLGYLDTVPLGEEERLLNRDKSDEVLPQRKKWWPSWIFSRLKKARLLVLTLIVIISAVAFASNKTELDNPAIITLDDMHTEWYNDSKVEKWKFVTLSLYGPFQDVSYHSNKTNCTQYLFICGPSDTTPGVCPNEKESNCRSIQIIENIDYTTVTRTLEINKNAGPFCVQFTSLSDKRLGFQVSIQGELLSEVGQAAVAAVILTFVYLLIGFEVIDRTLAAMIGSSCVLAVLSLLNKRPSLETVVSWIDLETVSLLLGMMILVGIFSKTGFFDYTAVKAYKAARGRAWPLLLLLCGFSAFLSAFLDNVTTILLIVPVSIRLSEVLNLDPRPVLVAEVIFSNIGGTATAIGDPPNVIIVAHRSIIEAGITFSEITLHLLLGTIFILVTAFVTLSVMYTHCFQYVVLKNKDLPHIAELKREITIWERTAKQLSAASPEERAVQEALNAKAMAVTMLLHQEECRSSMLKAESWQKKLSELEENHRITDRILLVKSIAVLISVVILFFLSNVIPNYELGLGWIALFGSVVMMILSDIKDLEEVMHKIEWSTLLFFAALFVLMEGLNQMGLINFVGMKMVDVIKLVPKDYQMLVALVVIVWGSAFVSAFIDNIPFVTTLIPVIVELAESPEVCLSLRPLVWALAFGGCLGGNATLIGASANVVCAGIAEQNGYKISFKYFMKHFRAMLIELLDFKYLQSQGLLSSFEIGISHRTALV